MGCGQSSQFKHQPLAVTSASQINKINFFEAPSYYSFKSKSEYIRKLLQGITNNDNLTLLLHYSIFQEIKRTFNSSYYFKEEKKFALIKILQEYIKFSVSLISDSKFQNRFQLQNFGERFGLQVGNIFNQAKLDQQNAFNTLQLSQKFQRYHDNLLQSDSLYKTKPIQIIQKFCLKDSLSIFYLTFHLILKCKSLLAKGKSIIQIQKFLKSQIQDLRNNQVLKKSKNKQKLPQLNTHGNGNSQKQMKQKYDYVKKYSGQEKEHRPVVIVLDKHYKDRLLNSKLIIVHQQAKQNINYFNQLFYLNCIKNKGFGYQAYIRHDGFQSKQFISKIKQQILANSVKTKLKSAEQNFRLNRCATIEDWIKQEKLYIDQVSSKILRGLTQIQFTVKDVISGKCIFNDIETITKTANAIIAKMLQQNKKQGNKQDGQNIRIVQVDNRLLKNSKDLILRITIKNLPCEFKFILFQDKKKSSINYEIQNIFSSQIYSIMSQVYRWNEEKLKKFLYQIQNQIEYVEDIDQKKLLRQKFQAFQSYMGITNLSFCIQQTTYIGDESIRQLVENQPPVFEDRVSKLNKQIRLRSFNCLIKLKKYKLAQNLSNFIGLKAQDQQTIANQMCLIAKGMQSQEYYLQASNKFKQSLSIIQKIKGKQNPWYAEILNNIGECFLGFCRYQESLEKYKQALQIYTKIKGKQSLQYATVTSNIGALYIKLKKYQQALNYSKTALSIKQKHVGKNNGDSIQEYNRIGNALQGLKRYEEALKYYLEGITLHDKLKLGYGISYAQLLSNVGSVNYQLKKFQDALEFYQKYLSIQKLIDYKNEGGNLQILSNLATIYQQTQQYNKAIQYNIKLFNLYKRTKGDDHKQLIKKSDHIAQLYGFINKYQGALEYYNYSYNIKKMVKNSGQIDFSDDYFNIGNMHTKLNNYQPALQHYDLLVKFFETNKIKKNIKFANTCKNMGEIYKKKDNQQQALNSFKKAMSTFEEINAQNSHEYTQTLNSLGEIYNDLKIYAQSLELFNKSLQILEKIQGKNNIYCVVPLKNIGQLYLNTKKYEKASEYYMKSYAICQQVQGKKSVDCAIMVQKLGQVYQKMNKVKDAQNKYRQALQTYKQLYGEDSDEYKRIDQKIIEMKYHFKEENQQYQAL